MNDAVVAVSTVKADPDQVERFVRRNLAAGVDHLVVFLDDPASPARRVLESHPQVTVVPTGHEYWNGDRPPRVSDRLRINMNVANAVLATVPSVAWLISIDSDEVACIDRDALLASTKRAVKLAVLEAVSRRSWRGDEPRLFKSQPTDGELAALAAMGVIVDPDLASYFRGHAEGKPALRPSLALRLRVHSVTTEDGREVARREPDMNVLHYESHSLDDFVRRWKDYDPASAHLRTHRDERKLVGVALHTLHHHESLSRRQRARLIKHLFDREVADDARTLLRMGLAGPPPKHDHPSRPLPAGELEQVQRLLTALLPGDKRVFNDVGTPEQIAAELAAAADRMTGPEAGPAVGNVRRTLERFHARRSSADA